MHSMTSNIMHIAIFLISLVSIPVADCDEEIKQLRRRKLKQKEPCTLFIAGEQLENHKERMSVHCELQGRDANTIGGYPLVEVRGVDERWLHEHEIVSGETTVEGGELVGGNLVLPDDNVFLHNNDRGRRRLAGTMGKKSMLVVRVNANDSRSTQSESQISKDVFGNFGYAANLASQVSACSSHKLVFTRARHQRVKSGIYTLSLNENVRGRREHDVEKQVMTKLKSDLGDLKEQFDHIMLCLPPAVGSGWIAYAYIGGQVSVYNDKWCNSVSAQMHEVGHNLGLGHSGEGNNPYADNSGVMGFSSPNPDGPLACYNAPKSWQLGWYRDRQIEIDGSRTRSQNIRMVGISEYDTSRGYIVLVRVKGDSRWDYYINVNTKSGRNSGTREGGDQVLVTRQEAGGGFVTSYLVGKLDQGRTYKTGFAGGRTLQVTVNSFSRGIGGLVASVNVST